MKKALIGMCFNCGEEFTEFKDEDQINKEAASLWTDKQYEQFYLKKYGIPYKPEYCSKACEAEDKA